LQRDETSLLAHLNLADALRWGSCWCAGSSRSWPWSSWRARHAAAKRFPANAEIRAALGAYCSRERPDRFRESCGEPDPGR
jgi:hypothetical protein